MHVWTSNFTLIDFFLSSTLVVWKCDGTYCFVRFHSLVMIFSIGRAWKNGYTGGKTWSLSWKRSSIFHPYFSLFYKIKKKTFLKSVGESCSFVIICHWLSNLFCFSILNIFGYKLSINAEERFPNCLIVYC